MTDIADENKKQFTYENGKKLVDEFAKLQETKKQTEQRIEEIRNNIIEFAKFNETDRIVGTNSNCSVKEYEKVIYPKDKTELLRLIKNKGIYDEVSSVNYFKLGPKILRREIDDEIIALTGKEKAHRLALKRIG